MDDLQIEQAFIDSGGRWDGDYWVIEDADLHPFVRSLTNKLKSFSMPKFNNVELSEETILAAVAQRKHPPRLY